MAYYAYWVYSDYNGNLINEGYIEALNEDQSYEKVYDLHNWKPVEVDLEQVTEEVFYGNN